MAKGYQANKERKEAMNGASIRGAKWKEADLSGADLRDFGTTSPVSPDDTYIISYDELRIEGAIFHTAPQCR